jgi:nicotinamide phosphoribosyltransferase
MMRRNFICQTDSYHWTQTDMNPDGTTRVHAHLLARPGGEHDHVLWNGLQPYLLDYLQGEVVTDEDIREAKAIHKWHLNGPRFNEAGWRHIVDEHGGRLPLEIKAAPEGLLLPVGCPLMTVENTDPKVPFLVAHPEALLMKVWYPTEVATRDWHLKHRIREALVRTGCDEATADYMVQDFGYRGVSSEESARIGAAAHLIVFKGTDTIEGMRHAMHYYGARRPGVSVAASQHENMTALGKNGEIGHALHLIYGHQNQILSLVADSYDYYRFVDAMLSNYDLISRARVRLVIRPDSTTQNHRTPEQVVLWTLLRAAEKLPTSKTITGHTRLPGNLKVMWGDGLDPTEIAHILDAVEDAKFAVDNIATFGMGGGLLQKVNRDTDRFKYAYSAHERDGQWYPLAKEAPGKASHGGRVQLVFNRLEAKYAMVDADAPTLHDHLLQPVFRDGVVLRQQTWDDVVARAAVNVGTPGAVAGREVTA